MATGVRVRGDGEPEVVFRTDGFGPLDQMARTPADSSWPNRIEAPFTALRHFAPRRHRPRHPRSMIRRCIIRRNRPADDRRLRAVVGRAGVA
ncbi:hypothetical protein [Streptomyces brevispora]|uniref:hypothetical protein n=1 Tax=Streptomyces brevispora TaxID=887462 RepID=UPI0038071C30